MVAKVTHRGARVCDGVTGRAGGLGFRRGCRAVLPAAAVIEVDVGTRRVVMIVTQVDLGRLTRGKQIRGSHNGEESSDAPLSIRLVYTLTTLTESMLVDSSVAALCRSGDPAD